MEREIPAEERCPYCGALMERGEERPEEGTALECLRKLAALWDAEPIYVGMVLLRVGHPRESNRGLARRLGCTAVAAHRARARLEQVEPMLARFAFGAGTKRRGLQGGRHKASPAAGRPDGDEVEDE